MRDRIFDITLTLILFYSILFYSNLFYSQYSIRVTAIPGNMPGAVQDRENLSREVPPGKLVPGVFPLPSDLFPGIAVTHGHSILFSTCIHCWL